MVRFEMRFLGGFRIALDGQPVTGFESDRVRGLLAYLAVERGRAHRRVKLAGMLWPGWPDQNARQNLSQALYNLRSVIGDRERDRPFLIADRNSIQFNCEMKSCLDVSVLDDLPAGAGLEKREEAIALYEGEFLAGLSLPDSTKFENWVQFTREHLQRQVMNLLVAVADELESTGALDRAMVYGQRMVELDAGDERGHRQVMRLLVSLGNRNGALSQYRVCEEALFRAFGVGPSQETVALFKQIQRGDLLAPGEAVSKRDEYPAFLRPEAGEIAPELPVFVGREPQLEKLDDLLSGVLTGSGRVAFVVGGPGRGKTTLMEAFGRHAMGAHQDLLAITGRCNAFGGYGDAFHPFREMLTSLAGEVESEWKSGRLTQKQATRLWKGVPTFIHALLSQGPHLVDVLVPSRRLLSRASGDHYASLMKLSEAGGEGLADLEQKDLFEQVTQVLCRLSETHPLLILLDDLQWADGASCSMLFHLGRRITRGRIMVVGAYRPEEIALGRGEGRHPLEPVLAELKLQHGDTWIDLSLLDDRGFVDALVDTEPNLLDHKFRKDLYRQAGGQPLFTIEMLRTMQERGDLIRDEAGRWIGDPSLHWASLPARTEGVIAERIGRLDDSLREILNAACVEGENFTVQAMTQLLPLSERQLLRQLGELEKKHRLVHEMGDKWVGSRALSRYRFRHALFQKYLYLNLAQSERRLLHGEVANALEELYQGTPELVASQLAQHFQAANNWDKAIYYLLMAGDRSRSVHAYQDAIDTYRTAAEMLMEKGLDAGERTARVLMKLGALYHTVFNFERSAQAYKDARFLSSRSSQIARGGPIHVAPHSLRIRHGETEVSFDPLIGYATPHTFGLERIFSGLVRNTVENDLVPDMARYWEVQDNGQRYLFYLQEDAVWSDGVPVTAGDFVYAWKRVLDPARGLRYANMLYDIRGARLFHRGEKTELGCRAVDEKTLSVDLTRPVGHFLHLLSCPQWLPVPQHLVRKEGDNWARRNELVCNGPFKLVFYELGNRLVFERNTTYRGPFHGNVERVIDSFIPDTARALEMYANDQLDVIRPDLMDPCNLTILRRYAAESMMHTMNAVSCLGLNCAYPPFDDIRVRQALAMAVNKRQHVREVWQGIDQAATGGIIPSGMPGHAPDIGLPYDPEVARELLRQAGYGNPQDFPQIMALSIYRVDIEWLSSQWRDILGIEVSLELVKWPEVTGRLGMAKSPMILCGWITDYCDPDNLLRVFPIRFWVNWHHVGYESLIEKARGTLDLDTRLELYHQADKILIEEAAIIPLRYRIEPWLIKPWIRPVSPLILRSGLKDLIIDPH